MKEITAPELQALRNREPAAVLLDVRLPEDHAAAHLPHALSACVFEIAFPGHVARLVPDKATPVVVYGAGAPSLESAEAAEKLRRLGYADVRDFRGGVLAWREARLPFKGGGTTVAALAPLEGERPVDLAESRVEWTGRNLLNKHSGLVPLTAGKLLFRHGWLVAGEFTLDLTGLTCTDLADPQPNAVLVEHLKGDDFLDVARFPAAWFVLRKVEPVHGATPGAPNLRVTGDLTLKGATRPLAFLAAGGRTPEGRPAMQAAFALDRTLWNVRYGSGKFFQRLGRHLVNDLVELQVRLLA
jgi:rhodanese-related sulfurtransferase